MVDLEDSSVARCRDYLRLLFRLADLEEILERKQDDFPPELYPVHMFALTPKTITTTTITTTTADSSAIDSTSSIVMSPRLESKSPRNTVSSPRNNSESPRSNMVVSPSIMTV